MTHITHRHMLAMTDELSKEAGVMDFVRQAVPRAIHGLSASNYGKRALLGAGIGAATGAATAEEGERRRGALRGALLGGAVGGASSLVSKAGRQAIGGDIGNLLKRQRYSITGRGVENLDEARKIGLVPKTVDAAAMARGGATKKAIEKALKDQTLHEEAFRKGYLSAPGVVHGLMSRNAGDVLRSGWNRAGWMGKGFAGLGAYQAGKGFLKKPEEGGPGRLESGMRGLGSTVGWLVAPGTMVGGQLVGGAGGWAGGKVGKLGDVLTRKRQPAIPEYASYGYPQEVG